MLLADRVIWLDDAGWSRKGRTHRSLLMSEGESAWIRVPVLTEDRKKAIREVRIDQTKKWPEMMLKQIESICSRATYYDYFEAELSALVMQGYEYEFLLDWNHAFLEQILSFMEVRIPIERQSERELPDPPYYFESDSSNYLPQPEEIMEHDLKTDGFQGNQSMLHLFFALGPEFFKLADQIQQYGRPAK